MRILDVAQGSPEWLQARLGIPTASQADRILTPARLKPSSSAAGYRLQLLAEWVLGYPVEWSGNSAYMERGTELEAEARAAYEVEMGVDVEEVGLVLAPGGMFAGSPDGLVDSTGGLEIKCPAIHTHIGYLLDPESLAAAYRGQVQALLWLTGREWWDLWAYHPELPPVRVRVEPDLEWQEAWAPALAGFLGALDYGRERLEPYRRPPVEMAQDAPEEVAVAGGGR